MRSTALEFPLAPPAEDTRFSRVLRWRNGETPGPWEMQVHPTNRCNLKCRICWERRAEKEIGMSIYDKRDEISDERFMRLVDEAAELGVREWTIVGGGEPMVRDELVIAMCERIHGHGMKAALHTNGTRFKREHFERLIAAGLDRVRCSLDGPTQELNDEIRGGGFDKAVANLKLLDEMKRAAGVTYPIVTLHPVLANTTFRHLTAMIELAHSLGAAGVYTGHLTFEYPDEEGTVFLLNDDHMRELPAHVKAAQARARELGIEENFDQLLPDVERTEKAQTYLGRTSCGDGRLSDAACFEGWLSCVIHMTGQLGPCCVSYEETADNVKHMPLRDAWLGPFMTDLRKRIVTRDLNRFCAACHKSFIEPRSEAVRQQLAERLPKRELGQWDKWGGLTTTDKVIRLASRFGESLRHRGLRRTLQRAQEWRRLQSR